MCLTNQQIPATNNSALESPGNGGVVSEVKSYPKIASNYDSQSVKDTPVSVINLPNGDVYKGEVSNNQPNGVGILYKLNKEEVYGNWEKGQLQGKGKKLYKNGDTYIGDFVDSLRCGHGKLESNDKSAVYEGEWFNDFKHGYGEERFSDQSSYYGSFVKNRKEGQGNMKFPDDRTYDGSFRNDMIEGKVVD